MMKKIMKQLLLLVVLITSIPGVTGDFGSGGGVSTIARISSENLKIIKHKLEYYFYMDELAKLGMPAEQSSERENENIREKARKRATQEIPPENFQSLSFWIEREFAPELAFEEIYLADVITVSTRNRGTLDIEDIYSYHIRTDIDVKDGHTIKSVIGFELVDGSLILLEDIQALEVLPTYIIK